jgi:hypothetical protein
MVWHDPNKKIICSIFDFITTCHKSFRVTSYLNEAKAMLLAYGDLNSNLPYGIVTDFSWSLINSVQSAFNNSTISEYLDYCYELITKKIDNPKFAVKSFLCSTHFIHMISKKTKKITENQKELSQIFNHLFSILQNSTSLSEFTAWLKDIIHLTGSEFKTKQYSIAYQSINHYATECNKKLQEIVPENSTDNDNVLNDSENKEGDSSIDDTIRSRSKFTPLFGRIVDALLAEIKNNCDEISKTNEKEKNEHYNLEFVELVIYYLPIMPL